MKVTGYGQTVDAGVLEARESGAALRAGNLRIEWNGSATFNVYAFGRPVFCSTRYGASEPGGACTVEEAVEHMSELRRAFDRGELV